MPGPKMSGDLNVSRSNSGRQPPLVNARVSMDDIAAFIVDAPETVMKLYRFE